MWTGSSAFGEAPVLLTDLCAAGGDSVERVVAADGSADLDSVADLAGRIVVADGEACAVTEQAWKAQRRKAAAVVLLVTGDPDELVVEGFCPRCTLPTVLAQRSQIPRAAGAATLDWATAGRVEVTLPCTPGDAWRFLAGLDALPLLRHPWLHAIPVGQCAGAFGTVCGDRGPPRVDRERAGEYRELALVVCAGRTSFAVFTAVLEHLTDDGEASARSDCKALIS